MREKPSDRSQSAGVTRLLLDWRAGDREALGKLTPIVYQELRRLAHGYMRGEPRGHLLQTTALVHEAYMRLVGEDINWEGREHFFAIAARQMRRILVDYARRHRAQKRGGGARSRPGYAASAARRWQRSAHALPS